MTTVITSPVTSYADDVVTGRVVAGRLVRLAAERHLRDLDHGAERGLRFDEESAQWAIDFFPNLCKHSKGEWAGKPLELAPWQAFIIGSIFGWKRVDDDRRRFRVAYAELPRKNGKSTIAAGVGNLLAFFDDEPGAEVYAAATKRDQAKIVWGDARLMVMASPNIRKRVRVLTGNLNDPHTGSKFEPLGADADSMDGLNIHGAVIDELHAHKTRAMWDVIQTASGSRRQPLTFCITTAGFDRHSVCWEQHDYGIKVLENVFEDDTFFSFIASIDDGDDWTDPAVWSKANPNLGVSIKPEFLERLCAKAQQVPAEQNAFLRLHLDVWTEQATRWLDMAVWDENCEEPADVDELKQRSCYAGLDLSSNTDLTALELYFPDGADGGDWLHYYFVPEDNMRRRAERDRVPFEVWARDGFITATPGNVVDYDFIRTKLNELVDEGFNIREVAYDPWNATQLVTDLQADGFTCVPIRQGFASLSAPTKELEKMLLARALRIGRNPVTRWAASNVTVEADSAGNIKPSKAKSTERIDPIVAMVQAVDRATRNTEDEVSVYETRGFLTL
jgi:phage terminase large subunit-like protein